jgi:hypothetical protein
MVPVSLRQSAEASGVYMNENQVEIGGAKLKHSFRINFSASKSQIS